MKFKTGDRVRIKNPLRGERGTATILRYINDEGGVEVHPPLGMMRYWNVDALVKVKSSKTKETSSD